MGLPRAKELVFTCRKVLFSEALAIGLAEHGVEQGQALKKVRG